MKRYEDLTGQTFGRFRVLRQDGTIRFSPTVTKTAYLCECLCGTIRRVSADNLRSGNTQSCGCLQAENLKDRNLKHGLAARGSVDPLVRAFWNARDRCVNPRNKAFANYGGRGIEFRLESVKQLYDLIGLKPEPKLTLDRIDPNGHYEPGNVRWADRTLQAINKRISKGSRSPYIGVFQKQGRWQAAISYRRKRLYLGLFFSAEQAAKRYDLFARMLHRENARLNFPP